MDMMAIRRRMIAAQKRLPKEYQEVEYIESTGPQSINTSISAVNLITADLVAQFTQASTASQVLLCCSTNGPNWFGQRNSVYACGASGSELSKINSTLKKKINITYLSNQITCEIDGEIFKRTGSHFSDARYVLFNKTYPPYARLYSCVFMCDGEKIADYIPCYRKSDGEIGLYDLISKSFLTNSGEGEFQKGADV